MLRIKPPHEFRRSPRSIESSLLYWKASEYKVFLLYYAISVLKKFLPTEYLLHLSLLVFAVHTRLSDNISAQQVDKAHECLQHFYISFPDLYDLRSCSANLHSLIHLAHFVKLWGPLWTHSTFCFENANGVLKRHIHGTRNILLQAVFMMKMKQHFSFSEASNQLTNNNSAPQKIEDNMFVIGKISKETLAPEYAAKLGVSCSLLFERVKLNGTMYYSSHHEKANRLRDSTIICFKHGGTLSFSKIIMFTFQSSVPVA